MGTALDVGYWRVPCERDDGSMFELKVRKGSNPPEMELRLEALEKAMDEVVERVRNGQRSRSDR
jgi:hypothetical protein